jgi:hypothetical protein
MACQYAGLTLLGLGSILSDAWAVTELGQADTATLEALHAALVSDLPDWARGDVLAALHRLTGYPLWS